ncbi:recombinase family protein [Oceanobacillus caeni]|uniref:recombinase family protein n=1 Tax=Oceanobacillus caeni TaxID=405946 RepID=UPI001C22002C|nr:recombinase family protein [Oceanobacillus caeni]MBU8789320.1 recombinase family protein [Oceanobacillus caeni]
MKKAILYMIRPLEPNEQFTRQEWTMNEHSKKFNIQIIKKFSDIGYPASNLKRPALQEMIKFMVNSNEKMDLIYFYGIEQCEKDWIRIKYLESTIRSYVHEIVFIKDKLVEEHVINKREMS